MATARERVVSFLHAELERVATRGDDYAEEAWPEREGRVAGVLGALRAVGLLGVDEAEAWRLGLSGRGMERPTPSDGTRRAADELLRELLEAVPVDDRGRSDEARRFEGAVAALQAVGATSGRWYERLARRMGWPTACEPRQENGGGTQRDLRAVLAGPGEAVDGVRVLCTLRFEDGVSLLLRLENGVDRFEGRPWDFELVDDVGTSYSLAGGGGGGQELPVAARDEDELQDTTVTTTSRRPTTLTLVLHALRSHDRGGACAARRLDGRVDAAVAPGETPRMPSNSYKPPRGSIT